MLTYCFVWQVVMAAGTWLSSTTASAIDLVNTIREALVGQPQFHAKQSWPFDPHVAKRRNLEYEAINGHHSVLLIERFGLGEDGRQEERRQQQAIRDTGGKRKK